MAFDRFGVGGAFRGVGSHGGAFWTLLDEMGLEA